MRSVIAVKGDDPGQSIYRRADAGIGKILVQARLEFIQQHLVLSVIGPVGDIETDRVDDRRAKFIQPGNGALENRFYPGTPIGAVILPPDANTHAAKSG